MTEFPCPCGHVASDKDPIVAEAKAWHHAIHDHADMLAQMSVDQLTDKIREFRAHS